MHTSPLLTDWVVRTLVHVSVRRLRFATKTLCPTSRDIVTVRSLLTYVQDVRFDFNKLENKTTKHFSMLSTRLENVFTAVWLTRDY